MRTLTRRLLAVTAAAFAAALALTAPGAASAAPPGPAADTAADTAPQTETVELPAVDGFAAAPLDEYEVALEQRQQPPDAFECLWGWTVEVGGFYPEAWMDYAATFECSQIGPDMAGSLLGSLHDSPGGLTLHTGAQADFAWCCSLVFPPAVSGGEVTLTGPDSFYINSQSVVNLVSTDPSMIWVWTYLPEGCTGVGSPQAVCDIDSAPFDIT
ncbi:hypothetical protein LO763_15340 [Glycomyces sp. A-F 0318]|uniref:hypothetical protein n=1 Tax=Glycomyces amatae TaxID=2881355 RepID=UPI001E48CCBB|nr:hypothetical protein [Glycomyces amatae]MCD0444990.1 hypothetical protein [Glycomyces amatae]